MTRKLPVLKKNSGKKYRPGGVGGKSRAMMLLACIGSLLIAMQADVPNARVLTPDDVRSRLVFDRLYRTAEAITVKVLSDGTLGSGILIQQQGLVYTVVTNSHVLRAGVAPYEIKTADGQIYTAEVVETVNFEKYDLALLQFRSSVVYEVAKLGRGSTLQIGDEVFSAGFPFAVAENPPANASELGQEFTGFVLREGRVSIVMDRELRDGYRIGYTSHVQKGMSGGPVLNLRGELVAINGIHAYPLWDAPEYYQDGTEPCQALQEFITRSSFGIPIETVLEKAPKLTLKNVQFSPDDSEWRARMRELNRSRRRNVRDLIRKMRDDAEAASCIE